MGSVMKFDEASSGDDGKAYLDDVVDEGGRSLALLLTSIIDRIAVFQSPFRNEFIFVCD